MKEVWKRLWRYILKKDRRIINERGLEDELEIYKKKKGEWLMKEVWKMP